MKRIEMKKQAKIVLKKNYLILMITCLLAAFIGSEFALSISLSSLQENMTDSVMGAADDYINKGLSADETPSLTKEDEKGKILGTTNGVFSMISNMFNSKSIYLKSFKALENIHASKTFSLALLITLSLLLQFLLWFFVVNVFIVITRRIFLESRLYKTIPKEKFIFLQKTKTWLKVAKTMLLVTIYNLLWFLTIIGGIIKFYSYRLVPFILAENPNMPSNQAITLSRKMMYGHKWEMFKFDLSFILWHLLGIITFGLSDVFFTNIYTTAAETEFYVYLRNLAIENKIENVEKLNDKYLFEKPTQEEINIAYKDVKNQIENEPKIKITPSRGFKGFFENILGINLSSDEEEQNYEKAIVQKIKNEKMNNEINCYSYPERLAPIKVDSKTKKNRIEVINYMRRYSVCNLILLFFIVSFIGWIWEVSLHLVTVRAFVNRGTLHGPWLPIYGFGGIIILLLLYKFRNKIIHHMTLSVIVCGILEYFSSYILELIYHKKWWDYSGYFINLNGRICAEGLLIFALGGLLMAYIVAPCVDTFLKKLNKKAAITICTILVLIFAVDVVYSNKHPNAGKGITDYSVVNTEENIMLGKTEKENEIYNLYNNIHIN